MIDKAKAVCLTAESVRETMDHKWELGFFNADMLKAWIEKGDKESALLAVPVVNAWKAAMAKASENYYEFRVPKFNPRNPDNQPDTVEAEVLNLMKREQKSEHTVIDENLNAVRYFRAIQLTESCLICHGDPANSEKYWGRTDGKDITGNPMENWKTGDQHGAFEVVQYLDESDKARMTTMVWVGGIMLIAFVVMAILYIWLARIFLNPVELLSKQMKKIAAGDLTVKTRLDQHDAIGVLSDSINDTTTHLNKLVTSLTLDATSIFSISETLTGLASMVDENSITCLLKAQEVESSGEALFQNVNAMAATAEEYSVTANTIASAIEELNASVNEIAQNCVEEARIADEANIKSKHTRKVIENLGIAAKEINQIIEVINGIAKQSSAATEKIALQINAIQQATAQSVEEIVNITETIDDIHQISLTISSAVEEQSATVSEVAHSVTSFSTASEEISGSIQSTAQEAESVSNNIKDISNLLKNNQFGSKQNQSISGKLIAVAGEMSDHVRIFKLEEAKFDILKIKQQHLLWFKRILEGINNPESLRDTTVNRSNECYFGKWFYGDGKRFSHLPVYKEIEVVHEQVHLIAGEIVEDCKKGEINRAISAMAHFNTTWQKLFVKLDELYRY